MTRAKGYSKEEQLGLDAEAVSESERDRYNKPPRTWPAGPVFCDECDSRPCYDACPVQQMPDTLAMKAARANVSALEWAQTRGPAYLERFPDAPAAAEVRAVLDEYCIPGPAALAAVLPVAAGVQRVEEVAQP